MEAMNWFGPQNRFLSPESCLRTCHFSSPTPQNESSSFFSPESTKSALEYHISLLEILFYSKSGRNVDLLGVIKPQTYSKVGHDRPGYGLLHPWLRKVNHSGIRFLPFFLRRNGAKALQNIPLSLRGGSIVLIVRSPFLRSGGSSRD